MVLSVTGSSIKELKQMAGKWMVEVEAVA